MWTVVYMSQTADEAEKIRCMMEKENILVRKRIVDNDEREGLYYLILVPSREVPAAHGLIIDAEL